MHQVRLPWQFSRALVAIALLCLASFTLPLRDGVTGLFSMPLGQGHADTISLAGLPVAEPLVFAAVGREKARLLNAAIPFSTAPTISARPFALAGFADSRERALDCLASALWYEAGDDETGQRAVGQVVLNRVRHPAFPGTVCGVVFQGSERRTGCQFTFTCDGALARIPSPQSWGRARAVAWSVLNGAVVPQVGLATHYHTDWVHPIWSAQLDKITMVGTHIFLKWRGRWGDRGALFQSYAGEEPVIARLGHLSPLHRNGDSPPGASLALLPIALDDGIVTDNGQVAPPTAFSAARNPDMPPSRDIFQIDIAAGGNGAAHAMAALDLCEARSFCKVMGWTGARASGGIPDTLGFLYVRDRRTGVDRAFWNCSSFTRSNASQCLSSASAHWIRFDGNMHSGTRATGDAA